SRWRSANRSRFLTPRINASRPPRPALSARAAISSHLRPSCRASRDSLAPRFQAVACHPLSGELLPSDVGRRRARAASARRWSGRDLHIFKIARLVVDADARWRDPARELAGLDHLLHQALGEFPVLL